jgi:uncharacterized protein (TIGR02271 family)
MHMPNIDTVRSWQGATLVDRDGSRVGTIDAIYVDDQTGEPEWALVNTGLFGTKSSFVPLAQASGSGVYDEIQDTAVGRDTSGPTTDDAMTRSEEELQVGTETGERGRARLRKYVVTETQQATVPVQREEIRVEREPITDANLDAATGGPAISEEEHEVTLHEEEPVVEKRAVPRLDTETVTDERQVTEEVRKEQIEIDGDQDRLGR